MSASRTPCRRATCAIVGLVMMISGRLCAAPATTTPPKSAADAVIFRGDYPGWPWIASTPSGMFVCVWREGKVHEFSADGKLMLSKSSDGGRTWSPAETFFDVPGIDDRNVAIACLSDSDWLVTYNSYTRDNESRTFALRSADAGKTWDTPRLVCDFNARTRAAAVRLSTGDLILPFYRCPGEQALVGLSTDDGGTWKVVEISNRPDFMGDEWDVAELPDGKLVGIVRNAAPHETTDDRGWFYQIESRDHGRTWSDAKRTNLRDARSTSPAQIFLHKGRPVVLYSNARMVSVVMAVSDDPELLHWNVEEQLACYHYRNDGRPIRDGSYPVSVASGDGERFVVDYVHDEESRSILGYRIALPVHW